MHLPATGKGSVEPSAGRWTAACKFIFWPLVIAALAMLALELGAWQTTETYWGPFEQDPFVPANLSGRSVGFAIQGQGTFKCCIGPRSDVSEYPSQSDLRLWINDSEIGPAHAQHDLIRHGKTTGFSNWSGQVVFALPPAVRNDAATKVTVRYSLKPLPGSAFLCVFAALFLGVISYSRNALGAPHILLQILGYGALLFSILYLSCTLLALVTGWALPTTAPILWSAAAEWLARHEPFVGHVLLASAGLGVAASWLRPVFNFVAEGQAQDQAAFRFFRRWGLLITACALIFSMSGMWAGLVRPGDLNGAAIGGMIPFNDAWRTLRRRP